MTSWRFLLTLALALPVWFGGASKPAHAWGLSEPGHCVIIVHGIKEYDASCNRYYDSGKEVIRAGRFTSVLNEGNVKLMDSYGIIERGRADVEVHNEREHLRVGNSFIAFLPDHTAHNELSQAMERCRENGHGSDRCRDEKVVAGAAIVAAVVAAALEHEKRHDAHHERMQTRPAATRPVKLEGHFDATGEVPCSAGNANHNKRCKFGVTRGSGGHATVKLIGPTGTLRAFAFTKTNVTTGSGAKVDWGRKPRDDNWYLGLNGHEFYIIPDAVVQGG